MNRLRHVVRDSLIEAGRHLRIIPRNPEMLMFSTIQPVMFVFLFAYVFGGAIAAPGYVSYRQYLMPGIFAQTLLFGSGWTSVGIAEDMSKGFIDRLRSLPMAHSAVLIGRTLSDLLRNCISFAVMLTVALLIGFRFRGGLLAGIGAIGLMLLFSLAFSWIQALIGIKVKSVEAANSAGFIWMFPMTFVSSAFVPTETMPMWLRAFADNNPFTLVTNAARALSNGHPAGNTVWQSLLFAVAIIAVFATLSIRAFERTTSRA